MPDQNARVTMRNLLAKLFAEAEDINRIIDDAHLDGTKIKWASSSINTWHNILREAENQGTNTIKRLMDVVCKEAADNAALQQAVAAYLVEANVDSAPPAPPVHNPPTHSASPKVIDAGIRLPQPPAVRALPLAHADRTQLVEELQQLPAWVNGGAIGEKAVLRASGLPGKWINALPLVGVSSIDAITVISQLESLGHLDDRRTHLALGVLVEHLLNETVHVEGKLFLAYLLDQYRLVTDLAYLDQLRGRYAMLQQLPKDQIVNLGWQRDQPAFTWCGPTTTRQLEEIWSKRAPFLDTLFFAQGSRAAQAVCRIEFALEKPKGTGFLVAPNLVLTNNHVLPTDELAQEAQVRFGYRTGPKGEVEEGATCRIKRALKRSPNEALDFVLVELADAPGADAKIDPLPLKATQLQTDTSAFIIQHPMGEPQKVVLQDNWIVYVAPDHQRVQYLTNTQHGSSGSPVFNDKWEVIALHHSSAPFPNAPVTVEGNEGIPMLALLPELQSFLA